MFISAYGHSEAMYRYEDSKGQISFSDRAFHDGYVPMVKTWKGWVNMAPPRNLREGQRKYRTLVASIAKRHNIEPELVRAVIHAESHFNPIAVSNKGAMGLMQLMPGTAARFGVNNRQDPKQNINGGTKYLKTLLNLFDQNLELALAAYNAGENAVIKRGNTIPPYPETQRYVKKVMNLYAEYRGASE